MTSPTDALRGEGVAMRYLNIPRDSLPELPHGWWWDDEHFEACSGSVTATVTQDGALLTWGSPARTPYPVLSALYEVHRRLDPENWDGRCWEFGYRSVIDSPRPHYAVWGRRSTELDPEIGAIEVDQSQGKVRFLASCVYSDESGTFEERRDAFEWICDQVRRSIS